MNETITFSTPTSLRTTAVRSGFSTSISYRSKTTAFGSFVATKKHLLVFQSGKPVLNVYIKGKDSVEQTIFLPASLTYCIITGDENDDNDGFLIAGDTAGKLYIWNLLTGELINVILAHYQKLTCLAKTQDSSIIISGSEDSRCCVWRLIDLISNSDIDSNSDVDSSSNSNIKPFKIITDNTLPITDIIVSQSFILDSKIYTSSKDSTVRIYDVPTITLQRTYVSDSPVNCMALDSLESNLYLGLSNGKINRVNLLEANINNDGLNKIFNTSSENDTTTYEHHLTNEQKDNNKDSRIKIEITAIKLNFDGTILCSGDSTGILCFTEVVSKQSLKKINASNKKTSDNNRNNSNSENGNETNSRIINISLSITPVTPSLNNNLNNYDRKTSLKIPNLKRIISDKNNIDNNDLQLKIKPSKNLSNSKNNNDDFKFGYDDNELKAIIKQLQGVNNNNTNSKQSRGGLIKNVSTIQNANELEETKDKLQKMSKMYGELRSLYSELWGKYEQTLETNLE